MKTGIEGKAYASTTTHDDGGEITWTELDCVESIEHDDADGEASVNNRKSKHTKYGHGQTAEGYTLNCTYIPTDAGFTILKNARKNRTVIALAVMDGDITEDGQLGKFLDVIVVSAPKPEELEEFDSVAFRCLPAANSTYEPQDVTISAS